MVEGMQDYNSGYTDIGMILTSIEERFNFLKKKMELLTESFIEEKEEFRKRLNEIEKENKILKSSIEKIEKEINNLFFELSNSVKKDELVLVEKMLKDFQPLEFVRKKDIEDILNLQKENKNGSN